jgi:hypothetical protein
VKKQLRRFSIFLFKITICSCARELSFQVVRIRCRCGYAARGFFASPARMKGGAAGNRNPGFRHHKFRNRHFLLSTFLHNFKGLNPNSPFPEDPFGGLIRQRRGSAVPIGFEPIPLNTEISVNYILACLLLRDR